MNKRITVVGFDAEEFWGFGELQEDDDAYVIVEDGAAHRFPKKNVFRVSVYELTAEG